MAKNPNEATKTTADTTKTPADASTGGTRIHLNAVGLKSAYANMCDVKYTREEVYLNFGVTKPWEQNPAEVEIELSNRQVMSPYAAKRLLLVLDKSIEEYEKHFGELKLTSTPSVPPPEVSAASAQSKAETAKH